MISKKNLFTVLVVCSSLCSFGQSKEAPKLVVGVVVDQMRYDFLYRYYSKYGEGGFKRLLNKGYSCKNTNLNYTPTVTAAGHAAIYTGATPSVNGIIGNDWYERTSRKSVYCTADSTVNTVGSTSSAGEMSPRKMLVSTICDQLHLANNMQSKVIGIALKDRGAILPAGHTANAAYWYDNSGNWISSTYYMNQLPEWVNTFNDKKIPASYLSKPWNTLLPIEQYTESTADNVPFEEKYTKEDKPVFPHNLPQLKNDDFELIRSTPFGNSLTKDFAMETIRAEKLGAGKFTDFLTVSFSSTDYIGHQFGPYSIEMEDTYLRLDKDLEDFLNFLDTQVGKDNYLFFLTADHGAAYNELFMKEKKIPTGIFSSSKMTTIINGFLNKTYGEANWIAYTINSQIYLNHSTIFGKKLNLAEVQAKIAELILPLDGVAGVVTATDIKKNEFTSLPNKFIKNGYNEKRSGDVIITLQPGWMDYKETGTTHGTAYSYDTHVPLLWYGWEIQQGASSTPVNITDIAPTIATLLNIESPNGCTGVPISGVVK